MADRVISQRVCDLDHGGEDVPDALRVQLHVQAWEQPVELDLCGACFTDLVEPLATTFLADGRGTIAEESRKRRDRTAPFQMVYKPGARRKPQPPTPDGWPCPECPDVHPTATGLAWHKRKAHGYIGGKSPAERQALTG